MVKTSYSTKKARSVATCELYGWYTTIL